MLESYFDEHGAKNGCIALPIIEADDGAPDTRLNLYGKEKPALSFPIIAPDLDGVSEAA